MKKIILFIGFGLLVAGCNLLGNQKPQQSLPINQAYSSIFNMESDVTGAYNDLQDANGRPVAGADWSVFGSIIADNTSYQGSYPTLQQLAQHAMDANNGSVNDLWIGSYKVINDVNIILSKLPNFSGSASQSVLNNIKGQCLFIRGSVYFYLVNFYGKPWVGDASASNSQLGVPIVLKPVTSAADFTYPKRNTVSEVYARLKSDLTQASTLLPGFVANGEGNKYAALAMLLRVAMQQHDYSTAASLSKQIMDSNNYKLNPDVKTFFDQKFSAESIWEIANTIQDNVGVNISLDALYNQNGRGDIHISSGFVQALGEIVPASQQAALTADTASYVDTRVSELLTGTTGGSSFTLKYPDYINNSDNAPIFRYAEVLLDRAEALARMNGVNPESVNLLNQIRERAIKVYNSNGQAIDNKAFIDYKTADFATAQDLINTILLERRVELAFEGQRFFDLTRTGQNVVSQTGQSDAFNANDLRFPIPQTELDANKNLVQNPGYGS